MIEGRAVLQRLNVKSKLRKLFLTEKGDLTRGALPEIKDFSPSLCILWDLKAKMKKLDMPHITLSSNMFAELLLTINFRFKKFSLK